MSLTVAILTKDEAVNITACLDSLDWVEDIVVLDSGSTDGTLDIVRDYPRLVRIYDNPFMDFGAQRNWVIDHVSPIGEWILFMDADERSTPAFSNAVITAVAGNDNEYSGYYLTCRNWFQGRWLKYSALRPTWQLRLFLNGKVRFRKEGHGQREVTDGRLGYINEPYDHYPFNKGVDFWLDRHMNYIAEETELLHRMRQEPLLIKKLFSNDPIEARRSAKRLVARAPYLRLMIFPYLYIMQKGFLDGMPGLRYCLLRAKVEWKLVQLFRVRSTGAKNQLP